jgi:hypothetical protein
MFAIADARQPVRNRSELGPAGHELLQDIGLLLLGSVSSAAAHDRGTPNRYTPRPAGTITGMIGTVIPLSKSLWLIAEYDPGRSQQSVGLALLYIFPRR